MSVTVHPGRFRRELARRALSATDIAVRAGLSPATIAAALTGKAISERSLERIARALADVPTLDVVDVLILADGPDGGLT